MTDLRSELVEYVSTALAEQADPAKAAGMQAYMKTDMPFYGVQKPGRAAILREIAKRFSPKAHHEYLDAVDALWRLPHREEKYLAQAVAARFRDFIVPDSLPLYRRFIVEGAWWDFVDETATHMIRELVIEYPAEIWEVVEGWSVDEDMWLRRTAIICQVGAKGRTDHERLFRFCAARAHEREFFIRKAIGWALRDYARTDPEAVARFVTEHREELSPLSVREASKHISHLVGQ
ncbi:MAG TPA: DNA alkylation repair protein [Acidimicrobiia bacterium]|nr:DNA alkylation repair protein [Acidimicrobiia bacterium]